MGRNNRKLAEKIARYLFTPGGQREKAHFLQLYRDGKYLCGWSEKPMADAIEDILNQEKK